MLNYYELFHVSPSATTSEIKKIIHQQMRLWSHRTNAPQMERRQEAERMVRILEEMEEILLDDSKRDAYDQKLQSVTKSASSEPKADEVRPDEEPVSETVQSETTATAEETPPKLTDDQVDEQITEGEKLLTDGEYYRALGVASELLEQVKDRAEVWALLGRARREIGELQNAITPLVKASDLDSQNAAYVYDLGLVFEQQENQVRALEQFKQAYLLDQQNLLYKFKLGKLSIEVNNLAVGLPLLEQCYQADPQNKQHQEGLATGYIQASMSSWKKIHSDNEFLAAGNYPIDKKDWQKAHNYLARAARIPFQNTALRKQLEQKRAEVKSKKGRQFTGSWLIAILSAIFLIATQVINPSPLNIAFIALPILYIISAYTPKHRLYRKAFKNKSPKTDFAHMFVSLKMRFGTAGAWLISIVLLIAYFFITAFVMSIVIIYNFIRNFF